MAELQFHSVEWTAQQRKRKVRVWLPDEYLASPDRDFPLIVQADGQTAFSERDPELPFGSWQLDLRLQRLAQEGAIEPAVVIGIDNSPQRRMEYFPLTEEYARYERFIHDDFLPWARANFRLRTAPADNHAMGSSMGGMVSFALAANRPDVFGGAGCISPWFEHEGFRYIHEVMRPMETKPPIRVYFDSGIRDWRDLDDGHRGMLMGRLELLRLGFVEGQDFAYMVDTFFPKLADLEGTPIKSDRKDHVMVNQHTEYHFGRRCEAALRFLLGK